MFFQQRTAANATLSYFFGCAGHAKAIAIDVVAGDEEWFLEQARRAGAAYCLHESNRGKVAFDFTPLVDGQRLQAGNVLVDVIHTPGHTEDSVCLLVRDLRRGNEPWFVLTGDTLFVGAVGRPDLAGREQEMAARLHESLHRKLLVLPPELEIYPGHQAGSACGVVAVAS
jgi:hydroxyacylglutathione hydrolase